MNKRQLIEAIEHYDDEAPVVVSGALGDLINQGRLYRHENTEKARAISVSSDPDVIVLEL